MAIPPYLDRNTPLYAALLLALAYVVPRLTAEQLGALVTAVLTPVIAALVQTVLGRRE